ncbi:MAG: PepSY domain-containing protein [Sphingomonadales bacterium]|nr:PepSY domain-containing protein [Sphingomonadales bacterium]
MQRFARWHIWLGWLAALPLILWTASGLFMTLKPIEEVRGAHLRRAEPLIATASLRAPHLPVPVKRMALSAQHGRPIWLVTDNRGEQSRFAADGMPLPPVAEAEARTLAAATYAGPARLDAITRFAADAAPIDLRRARPSWQAAFADGTRIYVDADTGEVLAVRTRWWRAFDFMWGLHIMDPLGRENSSHVLLWFFAALALISSLLGTTLLFRRRRSVIGRG